MPAKWTTLVLIAILLVLTALSGYNYATKPFLNAQLFSQPSSPEPTPVALPSPSPISAVQIVADMQPEARIAQLLVLPASAQRTDAQSDIASGSAAAIPRNALIPAKQQSASVSAIKNVGGYLLVDEKLSVEQARQLVERPELQGPISEAAHLKPMLLVDHEGGSVQRLAGEGFTLLPSWQELCSLPKAQRTALLDRSAVELAQIGIDMVLAPVLDRAEQSKVYGDRICAQDTTLISLAASDYVRSFQQAGVTPVFKHFPGIGQTKYDLHKRFDSITTIEADIGLFQTMLHNFPSVPVMMSHVGVINQFADLPCSLSPACVNEVLTVYPERIIISDALDMAAVRTRLGGGRRTLSEVAVDAVAAGNTVLLLGESVTPTEQAAVMNALLQQYQTNATFATKVDDAARKVVLFKLRQ